MRRIIWAIGWAWLLLFPISFGPTAPANEHPLPVALPIAGTNDEVVYETGDTDPLRVPHR